jgi:DNA-binding MltR family transcriptional regulator
MLENNMNRFVNLISGTKSTRKLLLKAVKTFKLFRATDQNISSYFGNSLLDSTGPFHSISHPHEL